MFYQEKQTCSGLYETFWHLKMWEHLDIHKVSEHGKKNTYLKFFIILLNKLDN